MKIYILMLINQFKRTKKILKKFLMKVQVEINTNVELINLQEK